MARIDTWRVRTSSWAIS